jgi:hypothetical protein
LHQEAKERLGRFTEVNASSISLYEGLPKKINDAQDLLVRLKSSLPKNIPLSPEIPVCEQERW